MPDLAGVRAKLRRADEHRQAYDDLFESYLATHPYSILFEFDPESGWHVFPLARHLRAAAEREEPAGRACRAGPSRLERLGRTQQ